jgi:hypothetical protein
MNLAHLRCVVREKIRAFIRAEWPMAWPRRRNVTDFRAVVAAE